MDLVTRKSQRILLGSAFALPICLMFLVYLVLGFSPWGQTSPHSGDFLLQYLPIYLSMRRLFLTGDWPGLYYSFSKSLGGAMPAVYGFNGLGLRTLGVILLPQAWIQPGLYWINLASYGLTSLSMVFYLIKSPLQRVPLGHYGYLASGLAYSLSGFALAQAINPNFMELLPLLPILILLLEQSLIEGRKVSFSLLSALAYLVHFYTAYMLTIFLGIYGLWIIGTWPKLATTRSRAFVHMIFDILLGLGLAALWLLPILANLWQSKGAQGTLFSLSWQTLNAWPDYLAKLFLGSFGHEEWGNAKSLPQIFVSILFVVSAGRFFFIKDIPKTFRLGAGLVSLVLLSSFHWYFLDLIWHMGRRPVGFYFRNAWIYNFWLVRLGSFMPLSPPNKKIGNLLWIGGSSLIALACFLSLPEVTWWQKLLTSIVWMTYLLWARLGLRTWGPGLVCLLSLELVLNGIIGLQKAPFQVTNESIQAWIQRFDTSQSQDLSGRTSFQGRLSQANRPLVTSDYGFSHFSSSLEVDIIQGLGKLGMATSTAVSNYTGPNPILDDLFALQSIQLSQASTYWLDLSQGFYSLGEGNLLHKNGQALVLRSLAQTSLQDLTVLGEDMIENYQAIIEALYGPGLKLSPLVLEPTLSNVLLYESQAKVINPKQPAHLSWSLNLGQGDLLFLRLPQTWRKGLNSQAIQVNGQDYPFEPRFQDDLMVWIGQGGAMDELKLDIRLEGIGNIEDLDKVLYVLDGQALQEAMETMQKKNASLEVKIWNNHQVIMQMDEVEEEEWGLIPIPYSSSWKVKVNGQDRPSQSSLSGLATSLQLDPGSNVIEMTYHPPGLILGFVISLASSVLLFLWGGQWRCLRQ